MDYETWSLERLISRKDELLKTKEYLRRIIRKKHVKLNQREYNPNWNISEIDIPAPLVRNIHWSENSQYMLVEYGSGTCAVFADENRKWTPRYSGSFVRVMGLSGEGCIISWNEGRLRFGDREIAFVDNLPSHCQCLMDFILLAENHPSILLLDYNGRILVSHSGDFISIDDDYCYISKDSIVYEISLIDFMSNATSISGSRFTKIKRLDVDLFWILSAEEGTSRTFKAQIINNGNCLREFQLPCQLRIYQIGKNNSMIGVTLDNILIKVSFPYMEMTDISVLDFIPARIIYNEPDFIALDQGDGIWKFVIL